MLRLRCNNTLIFLLRFQAWPIWGKTRFLRLLSKRSKRIFDRSFTFLVVTCQRLPFRSVGSGWQWISEALNYVILLIKCVTWKIGPLAHLNGLHVLPRDNVRKPFTNIHNTVLNIQIYFHLLYWLTSFWLMANNTVVAFSLCSVYNLHGDHWPETTKNDLGVLRIELKFLL